MLGARSKTLTPIWGASVRQAGTIHSIQSLRAVAASLVALFHTQQAFSLEISRPLFGAETYLFAFGAVGVHIFFVISGLIMVMTATRPNEPFRAATFFQRRFLRIYPIYWLCALAYLGFHAVFGPPYVITAGEALRALALWPVDSPRIIGPAWTLSYEMFFYICFGLAMTLSLNRGLIALAVAFCLAIGIGAFVPGKGPVLLLATNTLLLEFLAGAGIGWLSVTGRLPSGAGPVLTLLGVALFGAGIAIGYERLPSAIMWGVPSALLVLGIITWERDKGAHPIVRHLGKLGDASYVLYLIHILVITMGLGLAVSLSLRPAPPLAALLVLVTAIILAELIHRGVEKPMMALFKSKGRRSAAPRPEPSPSPAPPPLQG